MAGDNATELAVHFECGQDPERAAAYLEQAADKVLRRHGYREAVAYLTRGVEALRSVPETPKKRQQELGLQITLAGALQAAQGMATPDVERAYTRAHELCRQIEDTPQLFAMLVGLFSFYVNRGALRAAGDLALRLEDLARRSRSEAMQLRAHSLSAGCSFCRGEFAAAQRQQEQALALYEAMPDATHADPEAAVTCLVYATPALWCLGRSS